MNSPETFTQEQIERGFNEWLACFMDRPETFANIVSAVMTAEREERAGQPRTYGREAFLTLRAMLNQHDQNNPPFPAPPQAEGA